MEPLEVAVEFDNSHSGYEGYKGKETYDIEDENFLVESTPSWLESWWSLHDSVGRDFHRKRPRRRGNISGNEPTKLRGKSIPSITIDEFIEQESVDKSCYSVKLETTNGLGLNLLMVADGLIVVCGFSQVQNGKVGPAKVSGCISMGDILIAIENQALENLDYMQIERLLEYINEKKHTVELLFRYGSQDTIATVSATYDANRTDRY